MLTCHWHHHWHEKRDSNHRFNRLIWSLRLYRSCIGVIVDSSHAKPASCLSLALSDLNVVTDMTSLKESQVRAPVKTWFRSLCFIWLPVCYCYPSCIRRYAVHHHWLDQEMVCRRKTQGGETNKGVVVVLMLIMTWSSSKSSYSLATRVNNERNCHWQG
jgi:hypothetical protein